MFELNKKIKDLVPYEPISGEYKIRLDANESPFELSEEIMQKIIDVITKVNFNRYPDPNCTELTQAFASYYKINPINVAVGNGSDELISVIESAFLCKGEKLLVINPDFSMYQFYSKICEIECMVTNKDNSYKIDVNQLINKINSDKISAAIFSNPCNPTAQGLLKEDVKHLINNVNALVILDEAYMDFWDQSLINEAHEYDNLIVLRTASKAVGFASLRLGFAISNVKIINAIKAVKSPYNVNSISQAIGTTIYNNSEILEKNKKIIVNNTKMLYNELMKISEIHKNFVVFETNANFVFIKTDLCVKIFNYLEKNSVAIRKFDGFLRITSGSLEENSAVIYLINKFFVEEV